MVEISEDYQEALSAAGIATLTALGALEAAVRYLHPPQIPQLREALQPHHAELERTLTIYRAMRPPEPLAEFHARFGDGAELTGRSMEMFLAPAAAHEAILKMFASMRTFCRALESLYALRRFPPLSRAAPRAPPAPPLRAACRLAARSAPS